MQEESGRMVSCCGKYEWIAGRTGINTSAGIVEGRTERIGLNRTNTTTLVARFRSSTVCATHDGTRDPERRR